MTVTIANEQREAPVDTTRMGRLARRAVRHLQIRARGRLAITFVDSRLMRTLNRRFLRHDYVTDVLSFRYDGEPVVGEIVIAPRSARTYANTHGLAYEEELSRYVLHGLLHWKGHADRTSAQQRTMRTLEDRLLRQCGTYNGASTAHSRQSTVDRGAWSVERRRR